MSEKNKNEEINATITENTDTTNNRSRNTLSSDVFNSTVPPPLDNTSASNDAYQRPMRNNRRKDVTFTLLAKKIQRTQTY